MEQAKGKHFYEAEISKWRKNLEQSSKLIFGGLGVLVLWLLAIEVMRINYVIAPFLAIICFGSGIYYRVAAPGKIQELEDSLARLNQREKSSAQ
ncbi:MAG: hypothetical protein LBR98_08090 [Syntrophomonadaceae bacterium]|jgi:ABC-type bacteriocin/lantibiotic exporter with double-glycine peptidase domain|nr:hypothetical protein [Syntrophomonadaceae bacterium]